MTDNEIRGRLLNAFEWLEGIKGSTSSDENYENADIIQKFINCYQTEINRQEAEIERLQKILENRSEICDICTENYTKRIERVKMKAYQELADELKRHCSDIPSDIVNAPNVQILWDAEDLIDGVLKDMMEGSKDEKNNL